MRKNTAPIAQSPDTANENQVTVLVDAAGYVVGGSSTRRKPDGLGFIEFLRATRDLYPLEHDAIEMQGWPVDAEGRGLSVLEHAPLALGTTYVPPTEEVAP